MVKEEIMRSITIESIYPSDLISRDELIRDIASGDAPVSGYAVVDWIMSKQTYKFDSYARIKYSKDSIPIQVLRFKYGKQNT